jgi:hypothetical protein
MRPHPVKVFSRLLRFLDGSVWLSLAIVSPSTEGRGNPVGQIPNDKAQMSKEPVRVVILTEIASAG